MMLAHLKLKTGGDQQCPCKEPDFPVPRCSESSAFSSESESGEALPHRGWLERVL